MTEIKIGGTYIKPDDKRYEGEVFTVVETYKRFVFLKSNCGHTRGYVKTTRADLKMLWVKESKK